MTAPIQAGYRTHQQPGWVGDLAKPTAPWEFIMGEIHATGTDTVAAGTAVAYDDTENAFVAVADSDAGGLTTIGIVSFDSGSVASTKSAPGTAENSDAFVAYGDGDYAKIGIMGTFWAVAGGALEFGDAVRYDSSEVGWVAQAAPVAADIHDTARNACVCVSHGVADGELFQVRLSGPTH